MKTIVITLLPVTLVIFCSPGCTGKEQGRPSESSAQQKKIRTQPEEPTDPRAIRETLQGYLSAQDPGHSLELYAVRRQGDRILPT